MSGADADPDRARACVVRQARYAIDARIDVVQIRERDLGSSALAALVSEIVRLARGTPTRVVVNDRLDVALASGADGVHLPSYSIPPAAARAIAPPGFMIGRSVHGLQDVAAVTSDVDYLIAGTLWPTESKPGEIPLLGLAGLADVARAATVPVLAIGGVDLDRIGQIKATGAAGAAAVGLFMGSPDSGGCRAVGLIETVQNARAKFDTTGRAS